MGVNNALPAPTLLTGRIAAGALGLVAGFVDGFGYLRWHAFGANMTGNTVIFAISLHRNPMSAVMPLTLIVVFLAGTFIGRAAADRLTPAAGLSGEAALLAAAAFAPGSAALGLMSLAMGVQNASMSTFAGVRANTGFLTGDYSNLGQAIADCFFRRSDETRRTVSILSPLIAAYAGGALLAAFFSTAIYGELLVVPVVLAIAYATHRGALK